MKRILLIFVACVALTFSLVSPVGAITNPDAIGVGDVYVFEDVLETGDALVFMRYNVEYGTDPTEDPDDTYLMAIYNTDGTTLLFVRPLNYYQENIISIYLTAEENTLVSESAYYVRVMGNPAVFDPIAENTNMDTWVLSPGDYYSADDLGGVMITQAGILEDSWSLTLLTSGDRLNTTGSYYFREAIPGLTTMAPEIFQLTVEYFVYQKENFTQAGINQTTSQLPVSLNSAMTGLNEMLGITNHNWGSFGWVLFMGLMVGGTFYAASRRPDMALLGGVVGVVGVGAYMGVAEGNVMLFLMALGMSIIILFAIEYFMPRL